MKWIKYILLLLILIIGTVVFLNYPKLNIMSGYSAKSMASSVFLAGRDATFTDNTDNAFSPVNIAEDEVNNATKTALSSVYGFKERKAVYQDGLGCVLVPEDTEFKPLGIKPNRNKTPKNLPFPYGNLPQKDTTFSNVNYPELNKIVSQFMAPDSQTRAIVVVYKDHIIAEQYAKGFDKNSKLLGWSMTKSLLSTIYGVMQHQGKININDKAPIETWQNDDRKNITYKNLLEMNSGLEWDEDYGNISDVTRMLFLEPNMTTPQIDKPQIGKPNETWYYSSGTTNLLSGLLRKKFNTHQEYLDYPYREFIDKIGMHSMLIETDFTGHFIGSSYGWATARDWAKFGLLYLHKGNWNGEQIFKPEWETYAKTPTPDSDGIYGAQFWLNAGGKLPDVPKGAYFADGFQGQRVFIVPSKDLVVVRLGLENNDFNALLSGIIGTLN